MKEHFDIDFNSLFCITNMPIARFASYLKRNGELQSYMEVLKESYNPKAVDGLMCRNTVNVSWLGEVYDCDFNQMMNLPLYTESGASQKETLNLWDIDYQTFENVPIRTGNHCFGCTAGSGSSCSGAIA